MPKHNTDPVLAHLVRAVNESRRAAVPITVCAHGMVLTGVLIAQETYFINLVERPLMNALEAGHHLHLRGGEAAGDELGLWRISLESVDAWTLRAGDGAATPDDRGPFARLLNA
jgi:hypothetical protein